MYVTVFNCVRLSVMVEVTVLSTVLVYQYLMSQVSVQFIKILTLSTV